MQTSQVTYSIRYPNEVNQVFNLFNPQELWIDLTQLSDTHADHFPDRFSNSSYGEKAAKWLQTKVELLAKEKNRDDVTVYTIPTGTRYKQPSVVMKIGNSTLPGIVIGAHLDTVNGTSADLRPGADDDGTGCVTMLAVAKTLLASELQFKKPIYIIWYAAEEVGLIGSQFVVKDFIKNNIPVDAVLQLDMTGYENNSTMWLIRDYVNHDLTNFVAKLVKAYVKRPVGPPTSCGYACSDHATWTKNRFKTVFPFESKFGEDNPFIHGPNDTINLVSLSHMTDYAKLTLAFVVELAEPIQGGVEYSPSM